MTVPTRVLACAALLLAAACSTPTSTQRAVSSPCHVLDGKADRRCTPGVLNPNVTQDTIRTTICTPGWTATIRPPSAYTNLLKTSQMRDYGETGRLSDFEEDHLIPLATGGSPTDPHNLWPEPRDGSTGARRKDTDEVRTQHDICAGRITLKQGQEAVLTQWSR